MNIGVVTFFNNCNYGSELQAMAMSEFCKQHGHEATFLKIKSSNKLFRLFEIFINKLQVKILCATNKEFKAYYEDRKKNIVKQSSVTYEMRNHIYKYVSKHLKMATIPSYCLNKSKKYDCFICGSDQIWSALKMPIPKANFLSNISSERKIAYAPSIGLNEPPLYYINAVRPLIKDFKYISVRERSSVNLFKREFGVSPELVVDPTILIGRDFWDNVISADSKIDIDEPYIFCYFLGELSDEQAAFISQQSKGRKVIILPYESHILRIKNSQYILANHIEFIELIKKADCVFTDSFHGTVFSILFEKNFFVFNRSHIGRVKQTTRIESLLELVDLKDKFVSDMANVNLTNSIDYPVVNKLLQLQRTKSIDFIESAFINIENTIK